MNRVSTRCTQAGSKWMTNKPSMYHTGRKTHSEIQILDGYACVSAHYQACVCTSVTSELPTFLSITNAIHAEQGAFYTPSALAVCRSYTGLTELLTPCRHIATRRCVHHAYPSDYTVRLCTVPYIATLQHLPTWPLLDVFFSFFALSVPLDGKHPAFSSFRHMPMLVTILLPALPARIFFRNSLLSGAFWTRNSSSRQ